MSRTFWSQWFTIQSTGNSPSAPQRHERLRRFQPLVEKMEERALLAALDVSVDARKDHEISALVAGAAASKATTTRFKGSLAIGGTKGDGALAGLVKSRGAVTEVSKDAKVAGESAADAKSGVLGGK